MKFYDRKAELAELRTLNRASNEKAVMCVITGVRRVGKTELIKHFFRNHDGLYFFVSSAKTSAQHLDEFSTQMKETLGLNQRLKIETWDDFFRDLFEESKKRKIIVAFDEFQRFTSVDKTVPFTMQKYFDLNKNSSRIFMLISGSSFGLLKKMFIDHDSPLFQRPSNLLHLKQFDFSIVSTILDDLGVKNFYDKVELYALFGGVPKYYDMLESYNILTANNAMEKLLFSDQAPLRREVRNIIVEEFGKQVTTYYSILFAVALGRTKPNEIADYAKIKETSLSPYLYDLGELLGAVQKNVPITEDIKTKRVRYVLKNNFFMLWFRFVYRNSSLFELGRYDELMRQFRYGKNAFTGRAFEEVCRQYLLKTMHFEKIGKWWGKGKQQNIEIDLLALDERNNCAIFAECKWQDEQPTIADLERLRQNSDYVAWKKNKRTEKFVFFSKSGFSRKTIEYAKENGWLLVDLDMIDSELSA